MKHISNQPIPHIGQAGEETRTISNPSLPDQIAKPPATIFPNTTPP
jgi:hypothetical protein